MLISVTGASPLISWPRSCSGNSGEARCLSVNDEKAAEEQQLVVNSLEDADNPYRAIFEVRKLDEGWDVLNLFDIVRLYETRQSGGEGTSATTVSEAQLIGRGARYCPFAVEEGQPLFRLQIRPGSGQSPACLRRAVLSLPE